MENNKTRENTLYVRVLKSLLDKIVALGFLFIFWWIYVICAVLIVVKDGFPIIYKQQRAGKNGKPFYIYKFRTMIKNADKVGPMYTGEKDPRITKVGNFLRKTSLDEIPQIFNVLKGDMCFVGYRPDVLKQEDVTTLKKYLLKPGITGLAQVHGRSLLSKEEKSYWEDLYPYVVSLKCDIGIILKTIYQVILRTGTN